MNDNHQKLIYKAFVEAYKRITSLDPEKEYILYGYGSIGKLILPLLSQYLKIKAIIDNGLDVSTNSINGIRIFQKTDLNKDDNVIISPFLYNMQIELDLQQYQCNVIKIND